MTALVARFIRGEDSIKVYRDIDPGRLVAVKDVVKKQGPGGVFPAYQSVESLPSLSGDAAVGFFLYLLEGWRPLRLCSACGGHGWRWVGSSDGEADRDLCPACHGRGGSC